jgi:hypothetical protein
MSFSRRKGFFFPCGAPLARALLGPFRENPQWFEVQIGSNPGVFCADS